MFHRIQDRRHQHDFQLEGGDSDSVETPGPDDRRLVKHDSAGNTPYPKALNQSAVTSTKSDVVDEVMPDQIGVG